MNDYKYFTYLDPQDGEMFFIRLYNEQGNLDSQMIMERSLALELANLILEILGDVTE